MSHYGCIGFRSVVEPFRLCNELTRCGVSIPPVKLLLMFAVVEKAMAEDSIVDWCISFWLV